MATLALLQLGNAIAGSAVPSVGVGNSLLCTLTLLDSVTQAALVADPASVVVTLQGPGPSGPSVALPVANSSPGVYLATAALLGVGLYTVIATGTTGSGAFTFGAAGTVLVVPQTAQAPGPWNLLALPDVTPVGSPVQALASSWVPCDVRTGSVTVKTPLNPQEGMLFAVADLWFLSPLAPILVPAQGAGVTIANPSFSGAGSPYGAQGIVAQAGAVLVWRYSALLAQWRFAF